MAKAKNPNRQKLPLKARVTCPHCRNLFAPGDIMWVSAHPDLQGLRRILLATRDAHTLYARYGFKPLAAPELMMEVHRPNVYAAGGNTV